MRIWYVLALIGAGALMAAAVVIWQLGFAARGAAYAGDRSLTGGAAGVAATSTPSPTPTGSINGTVTEEDTGDPIEGLCVTAYQAIGLGGGGSTTTDVSGRYAFDSLAPGQYLIEFRDCAAPEAWVAEYFDNHTGIFAISAADQVTVTAGQKTGGIDAALAPAGTISGKVAEQDTGNPLGNICVHVFLLHNRKPSFVASGSTDNSGVYAVGGLPAGQYNVEFGDCNSPAIYASEWYDDQPNSGSANVVTVVARGKTAGINAALVVGGSINGTVTDKATGDPISNVCVWVYGPSVFYGPLGTDSSGAYSLSGLPSGHYKIYFSDCNFPVTYAPEWYDDKSDFTSADEINVVSGEKIEVNAALVVGGTLNGTVTEEATSDPISNACVDVYDLDDNFVTYATTDDSGQYVVSGLAGGDYKIRFGNCFPPFTYVAEWYDNQPDFNSADVVTVVAGAKTGALDASLAIGGTISGTVTDGTTGDPVGNVCVDVYDSSQNEVGFGFTDASGGYVVGGLGSGDYKVVFFDCNFPATYALEWYNGKADESSAHLVSVTAGDKTGGVDASLAVGGSINGTVTDETTGLPISNLCIQAYDSSLSVSPVRVQ